MTALDVLLLLLSAQVIQGQTLTIYRSQCKSSNEECAGNDECCSRNCVLKNPGTNKRCSQSALGQRCLFGHDCEDDLKCGRMGQCCALYWQTCSKTQHCCDPNHRCVRVEGPTYRKCLYPRSNTVNLTGFRSWSVWNVLLYSILLRYFLIYWIPVKEIYYTWYTNIEFLWCVFPFFFF